MEPARRTAVPTGVCVLLCCLFAAAAATNQAPGRICAESEGDICHCKGQVYYGRKYVQGKPGSGRTTSFAEMTTGSGFKEMTVDGSRKCSNDWYGMGSDPLKGYKKWCYCVAAVPQTCPPTDVESQIADYIKMRQQRLAQGEIAKQIASGSYTIDSLQTEMINWWVQVSLAGQNAAIGNFVDIMQHAHDVPPAKSFLTVVLGWLGLILGALDRPVGIVEEQWKIIANAPAAMYNAVTSWKAAATAASGNFLEAAIQFRTQLPDKLTHQLIAVSVYINALRNIPESQRNTGLLIAYHHVTVLIGSTISEREAFNRYYNSFIDAATGTDWAPQAFYFQYGWVNGWGNNHKRHILFRPAPSGLDACTVAEYVFKLNQGCVSRRTPGFQNMSMKVQHFGGGQQSALGLGYDCSNLDVVSGCWNPLIVFRGGASDTGEHYYTTASTIFAQECKGILDPYSDATEPVPSEGNAFCLAGITPDDTFSACNMDKTYPSGCFGEDNVCHGSRRLKETLSTMVVV